LAVCNLDVVLADRRRSTDKHPPGTRAVRASVAGRVQGVGFREAARRRARELGVLGWVRNEDDGTVAVHAEGAEEAVAGFLSFLGSGPRSAAVEQLTSGDAPVEGHEQFAVRGVSAGVFVVQEHQASTHHFDLRLEVDGTMRSWAVPKGPSLDPAVKRLAVQVEDHSLAHNAFEGPAGDGGVVVWDRGRYEQGGRVPWPEALERGHAVFVLHGEKLTGGFALQRTRPGAKPQWLLVKRRDELARPGSDIVAEQPASVLSGRMLKDVVGGAQRH
jgi:DNA ligase D-like protein (predicted 3'-phosphoesterase)